MFTGRYTFLAGRMRRGGRPRGSTTTRMAPMLGKHLRDDTVCEEQSIDRSFKRQRIDEPVSLEASTFVDIPCEVLSRVVHLLPIDDVLSFRASSKQCREAVLFRGAGKVTVLINDESIINRCRLNIMLRMGVIARSTVVQLKTKVSPASYSLATASVLANILLVLDSRCHSVHLSIAFSMGDKGSVFFAHLCRGLLPGWRPSYKMGLHQTGKDAASECGEFALKLGCKALSITGHDFTNATNLEPFSNCHTLYLRDCANLHQTRLSEIVKSCKTVILEHCFTTGNAWLSDPEILCLAHCENIGLTRAIVSDDALDGLTACKQLSLEHCEYYSTNALRRLTERGVAVIVNGAYWPPPQDPPSLETTFWTLAANGQ